LARTCQHLEGGGLSGPVDAEKAEALAAFDAEGQLVNRALVGAGVALRQVADDLKTELIIFFGGEALSPFLFHIADVMFEVEIQYLRSKTIEK
jgi:hypothetical protein